MIRVTCPGCHQNLQAKEALLGRVLKCPKCGAPVRIELPLAVPHAPDAKTVVTETALAETAVAHVQVVEQGHLPHKDVPERLDRQNHYLICDHTKLVATWENNGNGWMLKTSFGLVSAVRNYEQLPSEGDFRLIELRLKITPDGLHLRGLKIYQLAKRWALNNLERGDDKILSAVTGPGSLNRDQKSVVRNLIKDQFMRYVWEHSDDVLRFLGSTDYHSSYVGS